MKKTVSILMSILMVLSVAAPCATGFKAAAETNANVDFMLSSPAPDGYDPADPSNPYMKLPEQVFSLSTMNELYLYESRNKDSNIFCSAYTFDNCSTEYTVSNGNYWLKSPNLTNSSPTDRSSSVGKLKDYRLSYVQAVGFDPTGSGKKDHIAFIGYSNYNSGGWKYHTYVLVQNLRTDEMYSYQLDDFSWAKTVVNNEEPLPYYLGSAYYAIAAGDFDNNGKETLVVSCPNKDHNIWEVSFNGSAINASVLTTVKTLRPDSADLLNGNDADLLKLWQFMPTVSFAVGDFNGDGVDQLAISTGFGNPAADDNDNKRDGLSKDGVTYERYVTNVTVMQYDKDAEDGDDIWTEQQTLYMYNTYGDKVSEDSTQVTYQYDVMHMGAITAGDINKDGCDEIVAAGYTSYRSKCLGSRIKSTGKFNVVGLGDIDSGYITYSIVFLSGGSYLKTDLDQLQLTGFQADHFQHDNDTMWPQIQIAAGYTNGQSNPEEIFINGVIYNGKSQSLSESYKANIFDQHFEKIMDGGTFTDLTFVAQVAVGNFDGNTGGREQFVYTLGFKERGGRDYATYIGIEGGCEFDDTVDSDGTITEYGSLLNYGCSNIRGGSGTFIDENNSNASQLFYNKGDNWLAHKEKCLNAVVCAVDCDDDGLLGKFNYHGYITTDPAPVAVLQASPYFSTLEDAGAYGSEGANAGTSYSLGYSFERTTSKGTNLSFSVGFAGELQVSHFKASIEGGFTRGFNETFEKTVTREYQETITANHDSVVISIVPIDIYVYDIVTGRDANGNYVFKEGGYTVSAPSTPVLKAMSVPEYNAAVDAYNEYIRNQPGGTEEGHAFALKKITYGTDLSRGAVMPDAEGNPYMYQEWKEKNGSNMEILSRKATTGIGHEITADYSYSQSSSHTTENTRTFNVSLTTQIGGKIGEEAEAWVGIYVNVEYGWTTSTTVSSTDTETCSGTVVDPDPDPRYTDLTEDDLSAYGFSWYLSQWKVKLIDGTDQQTPVIGYYVTEVRSPAAPPKDLTAKFVRNPDDEGNSSVVLTWTKPDTLPGYPAITGYYIYCDGVLITNNPVQGTPDPNDPDKLTYTVSGIPFGVSHKFSVSAVTAGTETPSAPVSFEIGWISTGAGIKSITKDETYVSEDGLTDKYVILFSDDTTYEFYVRNGKDGADGQNGQNGQSAYEAAVENGYTGTYQEWLDLLGASCSAGHTFTTYTQAASCTQQGVTLSVCSVCGKAEIEVTAAGSHTYAEVTYAFTCTERGYTVHTCTKCGNQYFSDFKAANGHTYAEEVTAPTCTHKGYTTYTCSVCGDRYIADPTDMIEHSFVTKEVPTTCVSDGFTIKYCENCGYTEITDETETDGHSFEVTETVEPTCTTKGYNVYTCAACGVSYNADETDPVPHDYQDDEIAPTCTGAGYTVHVCANCGDTYISDLTPLAAHDYFAAVTEPTCVNQGYTTYTCSVCGDTYMADITPAAAHNYVGAVTAPTCTHKGYTTYTCAVCGDQYIADLTDVTAHSFKTKAVESTCVSGGFTLKYCENCGFTQIVDETQSAGHKFTKTQTVAPTCLTKGYSVYTCSVCGVNYTADEVAPVAHTFRNKVIAPTCSTEGYTIHTCSACGYAYIDGATPVKAHTPGSWICEDPTAGRYVIRCEECYMLLDVKYVQLSNGLVDCPDIGEDGSILLDINKTTHIAVNGAATNGKPVIYASSDPDVVTVDANGNVTAVGPGEAVITVRVSGTDVRMNIPVKVKMTFWQRLIYQLKKLLRFFHNAFGGRSYTYIKEDYFS